MASVPLDPTDEPGPLVSRASIVILSAFLGGLVVADAVPRGAQVHALGAAAAGVLAFLALRHADRLREQAASLRAELRTLRKLEGRLDRHVPVRKNAVTGVVRRVGPARRPA